MTSSGATPAEPMTTTITLLPVHLAERIGQGLPVAWALYGFPIYGYREPDGSNAQDLDWLNGHAGPDGMYHYHTTEESPPSAL